MGSVEDFINNELERKDAETQALDGLEGGMQGEELLQRMLDSQQHYRALFQNSFDLVCLVDFSGRFLDVNPRMLSLLDYDREQMLSFNILSLLADEQKEGMQKMLHGLRKGRTADSLQELRLIDRAGAYLNLECVTSIMSRENKPHAVMLIARDITQAKKLEQQLQKSEQKFLILAEESHEMIFIATEDRLAYVNKASESMLGYSVEDLTSPQFNLIRIVAPEYKRTVKKIFSSLGQDADYPAQEVELIHRNGGRVSAVMNIKLTHSGGENAIFGVITDVSAIKTAEKAQFESAAKLIKAITAIIDAIAGTMELKDPYTFGHQMRVTEIAVALARELQLPANDIEGIRLGSMVHDIGKTYIPTQILSKPPPLNKLEFDLIKMHPRAGYDILKKIDFPWPIPEIALQHHERLDGSGYPSGLIGDGILFEARVVAVADVVEAMSAHRPYRPSMGIDKALVELTLNRDKLYDARVVDACQVLFYHKGYVIA